MSSDSCTEIKNTKVKMLKSNDDIGEDFDCQVLQIKNNTAYVLISSFFFKNSRQEPQSFGYITNSVFPYQKWKIVNYEYKPNLELPAYVFCLDLINNI